tara:strand:- start:361 stop:618 length:258 start_codon:yes stop_codon:yes gene_type:complete
MHRQEKYDTEILSEAFDNAYLIITGKCTFDEILDNKDEVMLPFNMLEDEECDVDVLIQYYEEEEEYERCAELMKFRNDKKSSVCI